MFPSFGAGCSTGTPSSWSQTELQRRVPKDYAKFYHPGEGPYYILGCWLRRIASVSQFHFFTLFRHLFSVLSSACLKCEIASRVFQPGESFLCDSENGWIVCSSRHHGHTALLQLLIRSSFNKRRCGQTSGTDTGILSRRLSRYIFRFTFITFNCLLLPWVEMPLCCLDLIQLIINVAEERRNVFLCKCRLLLSTFT